MGKKIQQEGERLSQKTGINFKKYHKPEMVEKIGDLIGFIGNIRTIMLGYYVLLLVIVTALCIWFSLRGMSTIGVVLFAAFGILFSASAGTALGTMKLAEKAVNDTKSVAVLLLDFVKEVKSDISTTLKSKPGSEIAASDLFKGISFVVFIPIVNQVIKEKLFFLLAKPVDFIVTNALYHFTNYLAPIIDKAAGKISAEDSKENGSFDRSLEEIKEKIEPLADSVIRSVKIPGKVLLILSIIICIPILLIIYWIF